MGTRNSWECDRDDHEESDGSRHIVERWGDGTTTEHRYDSSGSFVNTVKTTSDGDIYESTDLMNDDFEYRGNTRG